MSATKSPSGTSSVDATQQRKLDEREQLRLYFKHLPLEKQSNGWDEFWRKQITPWDRDRPNPALISALRDKPEIFGEAFKESKGGNPSVRKNVLVPGCGRGYDVLLFSSYGFNAIGLDVSPTAGEEAVKLLSARNRDELYPVRNPQQGRGEARFVTADFFADKSLLEQLGLASPSRFDLIYDYTFLCALAPEMRPRWAKRMSDLLAPDGRLICIEFPLGKDRKLGGPPYGLHKEVYEELFARPGEDIEYGESGRVHGESGRVRGETSGEKAKDALERVDRWEPSETFEDQSGKVMVSVWRHSRS